MSEITWQIVIERQAEKAQRRLPKPLRERIDQAILALVDNPYPAASTKLVGYANLYRLRVGDWRIIYEVRNQELIILIIKIAPRGNVYRDF